MNDPEANLIERVAERARQKDFLEAVLFRDAFDDWTLAKQFGDFLIRQDPDEVMGHALVARACRHLGDLKTARAELEECRVRLPHPSERDIFVSFLSEEEQKIHAREDQ